MANSVKTPLLWTLHLLFDLVHSIALTCFNLLENGTYWIEPSWTLIFFGWGYDEQQLLITDYFLF
jgi:hypothetical protein